MDPLSHQFVGRDRELAQMLDAWRSVCAGEGPRVMLLLADSGFGKTRLISEFYAHIAAETAKAAGGSYWPLSLQATGASLEINPVYPAGFVPTGEIPWLWWGLRWPTQDRRNEAQAERCALAEWQGKLDRHIKPMLAKRTRKQAMKDAGKILAGMALNFVPFGTIPSMAKDLVEFGIAIKNYARPGGATADLRADELEHEKAVADRAASFLQAFLDTSIKECPTVPVVLVLDDAQWADPMTLAFVQSMILKSARGRWPLLVLATHWETEWECALKNSHGQAGRDNQPATFVEALRSLEEEIPDWQSRCAALRLGRLDVGGILDDKLPAISKEDRGWILQRCDGNPLVLEEFLCICNDSPHWFVGSNPSAGAIAADWQEDFRASTTDADRRVKTRLAQLTRTDSAVVEFLKLGACQGMFFFDALVSAVASRLQIQLNDHAATAAASPHCITSHVTQGVGRSEFRHFLYYQHSRSLVSPRHLAMIRAAFLEVLTEWWQAKRLQNTVESVDFCELAYRLINDMAGNSPLSAELSLSLQGCIAAILQHGGSCLTDLGKPERASVLLAKAKEMTAAIYGQDNSRTFEVEFHAVIARHAAHQLLDAEKTCRTLLEKQENKLGKDDIDTLATIYVLANIMHSQRIYTVAAQLHREVLEKRETSLGLEHPDTIGTMNNLANAYDRAGLRSEAKAIFEKLLAVLERTGQQQTQVGLTVKYNFAELLSREGKDWTHAEALCQQAADGQEQLFGMEHPKTLRSFGQLAVIKFQRGFVAESESLLRRILEARRETIGVEAQPTLLAASNLALTLVAVHKDAEAEALYRDTMERQVRTLGVMHPDTVRTITNFSIFYRDLGNMKESARLYAMVKR